MSAERLREDGAVDGNRLREETAVDGDGTGGRLWVPSVRRRTWPRSRGRVGS